MASNSLCSPSGVVPLFLHSAVLVLAGLLAMGSVPVAEVLGADPSFGEGLVGRLASLGDLMPVTPIDPAASVPSAPAQAQGSSARHPLVRQSLPARDRSQSYLSGGEIFPLSRAAVPLLVADLEPRPVSVPRSMSGRSVGVRAGSSWTRQGAAAGAASEVSGSASSATGFRW
jgi:hypothetical protein